MATAKVAKTGKPNAKGMRAPVIVCGSDGVSICSNTHVWMGKDFVRVTTPKRVFEIDVAADSVRSFPTSAEYQRECAMVARVA